MIDAIKNSIQISDSNCPMKATRSGDLNVNDDMDLANPYGKMTCLILYIYSMELGAPPLYHEINRVCR